MGKRALITAAAGGIGAAIARNAKTDGYDVTISDIDTAKPARQQWWYRWPDGPGGRA